ncbi:MAG: cytochrome c3 family protein [Planctomycetota bacterium]
MPSHATAPLPLVRRGRWCACALAGTILPAVLACIAVVEDGGAASPAAEADRECVLCHAEQARDARAFGHHRGPDGALGCQVCHSSHALEGGEIGGTPVRTASCEECHAEIEAEFRLPFAHPAAPIATCTTCHPPHGLAPRALREHLRHEVCVGCHLEMAGPFLFEHDGDRNLACMSCHEAHGSANRRLLTHATTQMLCHSCHLDLEAIHIENPGRVYTECLLCHPAVHGSHWERELFR